MKKDYSNNLQSWLSAFRLRTLPLATASISLGSFLAASENSFQWQTAILCFLTAVILQILSNLANDYGDSLHGADSTHRQGPQRAVQSGKISKSAMRIALILFILLALIMGYILIREESVIFYVLGILAVIAALTYTIGPNPYGYAGLGDIFVLIFFGIIGVFGSYYLQTHAFNVQIFFPAIACGLFCVAVLNINNIRDLKSDKLAGKNTIPVRLGETKARIYHWLLLLTGLTCALIFTFLNYKSVWQFLFLINIPLLFSNGFGISLKFKAADLDPYLKQMAIITLLFSFSFGVGILL
ncbi:MAG: 1,4-dihydroxy-2-naphthoate polyprenyltransferase [bacterium]